MKEVINISALQLSYSTDKKPQAALNNIDFRLNEGEIVAVIGETGSGKSSLAKSLINLVPNASNLFCDDYSITLKNGEKQALNFNQPNSFNPIRGKEIALVYQEAALHLNPSMTCGHQLLESLAQTNTNSPKPEVENTLSKLGFKHIDKIIKSYPSQLSGGECQRVILAMAVLQKTRVLIVDEPTSSLDKTNEDLVLSFLKNLNTHHQTSIIFITHNISIALKMADRILVMKEGSLVDEFFPNNLSSVNKTTQYLLDSWKVMSKSSYPDNKTHNEKLLEAKTISVAYPSSKGKSLFYSKKFLAVNDVSFQLYKGDSLGILGASGSGKTTLARVICGLEKQKSGTIDNLSNTKIQMVFQNPALSLDPLQAIGDAICEVLKKNRGQNSRLKTEELLTQVKLPLAYYNKLPHELSGGEKQRVCIARALVSSPSLIIFDEATSALDTTTTVEILNLLMTIKAELNLTYIFITHDLSVINFVCNRVLKMEKGKVVF